MELSTAQFALLQVALSIIWVLSQIYDLVTYPFYYAYYKPWIRLKYHQGIHARKEERQSCIIFHSIKTHREVGITMQRNGLDTMDKIFDYVSN